MPFREIIVHYMNVSPPAPRHPLHELLPEVIERYRHLNRPRKNIIKMTNTTNKKIKSRKDIQENRIDLHPGIRQVIIIVP